MVPPVAASPTADKALEGSSHGGSTSQQRFGEVETESGKARRKAESYKNRNSWALSNG